MLTGKYIPNVASWCYNVEHYSTEQGGAVIFALQWSIIWTIGTSDDLRF